MTIKPENVFDCIKLKTGNSMGAMKKGMMRNILTSTGNRVENYSRVLGAMRSGLHKMIFLGLPSLVLLFDLSEHVKILIVIVWPVVYSG